MEEIKSTVLKKALYDFEVETFPYLGQCYSGHWLAWPIIKRPLFYTLLFIQDPQPVHSTSVFRMFLLRANQLLYLLKGIVMMFIKPRPHSCTFSHTHYKLEYNENGKAINYLTDPLILENFLENNFNFTFSDKDRYIKPSLVPDHFKADGLYPVIGFYKQLNRNNKRIKNTSLDLARQLNQFFGSKKISLTVDPTIIRNILLTFHAEEKVYTTLFKRLKPQKAFFVDSLGTGRMAAARRLNITTYDLQHGLIDAYKPDYILHEKFKNRKEQMPIPHYICTFGSYFSSIILSTRFWDQHELIEIGNYRIDRIRNTSVSFQEGPSQLFFPTQWHVFEESKKLINALIALTGQHPDLNVYIKPHPREFDQHLQWYNDRCDTHPQNLVLGKKQESIYEAAKGAHLCIGFDSTFLLESVAMGIPTLTIPTQTAPRGVHSILGNDRLIDEIPVVDIPDLEDFYLRFNENDQLRKQFTGRSEKVGYELFEKQYLEKLKEHF